MSEYNRMGCCGICGAGTSLICANCMNHLLLKYRIQQIDTDYNSGKYVKEIDEILANCINHNSYDYIKSSAKNSKDLATKLAQQLLNIEIIQLKKSLLMHKDKIDKLTLKNNLIRSKVEEKRLINGNLKKEIRESTNEVNKQYESRRLVLREEINKNLMANKLVLKQVKSLELKISQDLINLHDVVKKQDRVFVSFIPIVPINEYVNFNYQLVNANLLNVANFAVQSSSYLQQSPLMFNIFYPNESVVAKINAKQKITKFVEYNPIIRNRNECYPLYLSKNIFELNKYELGLFTKLIACLILNLVIMIKNKGFDLEISIHSLIDLGNLVWKLIGNNDDSPDRKESFLKMFWNLQKYKNHVIKLDMNVNIPKMNEFVTGEPSKTVNHQLINFEILSTLLFKFVASDIQRFKTENKEKFKHTTSGDAGVGRADYWEVV